VAHERWRHISRLYDEAVRLAPEARAAFLQHACASDDSLRADVESLLANDPRVKRFDEPSEMRSDLVGWRVGAYEITARIGAGGMGEVYRARDKKLGRDVAIKIVPRAFTADPERLARLEREARVLAALNHPHIATIHGIEERDGICALVMELVEGRTLAERISSGLAVGSALVIARQIAEAIEAAHDKGIIHRDLKPANIMITPTGLVKVLDFGVAKVTTGSGASSAPTLTVDGTLDGMLMGTAAYMSPEQARGVLVDKRTDIWAFGCVLYEMLAGTSAFGGAGISDTIANVLGRDPDWKRLPQNLSDVVRRLLVRCLQKDATRRLHDIADARIDLEDAIAAPPAGAKAPAITSARRFTPLAAVLITIPLVIMTAALMWYRTPTESAVVSRIVRLTDLPGLEQYPAISLDGRSVVFTAAVSGKQQVFVQLMAGGAALQITHDPVDHLYPRWSPDLSSILYFIPTTTESGQGSIWEISALGGVPRRIIESVGGADISPVNGRLALFRLADDRIQLVTTSRDGSDVNVIAQFQASTYHLYPRWSPDGRWVAFQRGDSVRSDIFAVPAGGGEPRQLTHDNAVLSGLAWLPDSSGIIYSSSRGATMPYLPALSLWHVALDDGSSRRVLSGEASYHQPDIARSGALVAGRMRLQSDIWRFPVDDTPESNVRQGIRVTHQTGQFLTPTAGPGDREVAFLSDRGGHANLWVVDTATGQMRQITHERDPSVAVGLPVWSPDGKSIAFVYSRGNQGLTFGVWLVNPDGSNLRSIANPGLGPAWSPDGRWVYYSTRGDTADVVLRKVPVDQGAPVTVTSEQLRNVIGSNGKALYYLFERPLVDGAPEFEIRVAEPEDAPFRVLARIPGSRVPMWQTVNPALSPDGNWLAQALTDGLTTNLWAISTASGEFRQITDFANRPTFIARRVSWSSDSRSIFAAVGDGDSDIVLLERALNVGAE
jgi:serine/threonine protein kinase/Tol biopolymer transport system component